MFLLTWVEMRIEGKTGIKQNRGHDRDKYRRFHPPHKASDVLQDTAIVH